ncbi:venom allergen 3 homolog isoform X2 [Malaya genurostris]|nr:venom allergen 3 homolog isoform X2 [Malaya genurostris]
MIITTLVRSSQSVDYCNASLCAPGIPHIACNGLASLAPKCGPNSQEIVLDQEKRAIIVDLHNQLRSNVATGKQLCTKSEYYPSAARMGTMVWNGELADIAAANARQCVYGHDKCRNTETLKAVGQNIAIKSYYGMTIADVDLINLFINTWFLEYRFANKTVIAKYPRGYNGPAIGHFTQIVSDRATQIGCSFVGFYDWPWIRKYFVCNYSITNVVGQAVYQTGSSCSNCTSGCNSKYPGLCNESEVIKSNP